jgi:hypothetical protein
MSVPDQYDNLTWLEGDIWYAWKYDPNKNRYYFDDIGNLSITGLWEFKWVTGS